MMRPIQQTVLLLCVLLLSMLGTACAPSLNAVPTAVPASPTPLPLPSALPVVFAPPTPTTTVAGSPTFSGQILPLLQSKCAACHGPDAKFGGFDVTTYSSVMTGGTNGPVIVPGDVSGSLLAAKILRMQDKPMPPSDPLSNDEIMLILNWISAGASEN